MKFHARFIATIRTALLIMMANQVISLPTYADIPFIGEIRQFPYNYCPRSWAPTDGSLYQISLHTTLFSILGTVYGGDGRNTFAVPNLNARSPKGIGTGPGLPSYVLGQMGGAESITLSNSQLPDHAHISDTTTTVHVSTADATTKIPAGALLADDEGDRIYVLDIPDVSMDDSSITSTTTLQNTGSTNNATVSRRQPYLGMRFCIATEGQYPPRS